MKKLQLENKNKEDDLNDSVKEEEGGEEEGEGERRRKSINLA